MIQTGRMESLLKVSLSLALPFTGMTIFNDPPSPTVFLPRTRTTFSLNIPRRVDYPVAFTFTNSTINPHYRVKVCVRRN